MGSTDTVAPELMTKWNALHEKLKVDDKWLGNLIGPFPGFAPSDYKNAKLKMLYVGKATMGSLKEDNLAWVYQQKSSPFWNFARALRDRMSMVTGKPASFAWSNLCKLGVANGNPDPALLEKQRALAVETLQQEIQDCKPDLVVFVSEGYADDFVYQALGIERGKENDFETHDTGHKREIYSRNRIDSLPAVLWLQHPQIKSNELLEVWLRRAEELIK